MAPEVLVEIASHDALVIELYDTVAANNFLHLVDHKYYDGLTFHRVIPGFAIQGGCPQGDGTGRPYILEDMPIAEGLRHVGKGVVGLASRGSQFYITMAPCPHLDGRHAVFGQVIDGLEVLDAIAAVETTGLKPKGKTPPSRPLDPVVIASVRRV